MSRRFFGPVILTAVIFAVASCGGPAANDTNTAAINVNTNTNTNTAADSSAARADVERLVDDLAAALVKGDAEAVDRIYADEYLIVNPDGTVQTKAERIAAIRSGEVKFESLVFDELNTRINPAGDGAVVVARATSKGSNKGRRVDGQLRVTMVFSKGPTGWKEVAAHTSQITAPMGTKGLPTPQPALKGLPTPTVETQGLPTPGEKGLPTPQATPSPSNR